VKRFAVALALVAASTSAASAVPNPGIRYPDNSIRYAVGYPNFDWPVVSVGRGESCTVVIEQGEDLIVKDNVPVIIADRTRWTAVGSRSGGQLVNGHHVPITWSVTVQPANDADDTWLTIVTGLGNRYMVHLVAVDRHSRFAQQLVGFYLYHPPQKRIPQRHQLARPQARTALVLPSPSPAPSAHHHRGRR
jgi:hypothetical protein